jgi:hypothetical protein
MVFRVLTTTMNDTWCDADEATVQLMKDDI